MKCPKCNGDKGQWDIGNYHWYPCDSCHETGEVEKLQMHSYDENGVPITIGTGEMIGNSEQLKSRSVQRREALQKGEKMPEFDKPEMPERRIEMDIKIAREIAARIWCDQEMRSVEMDSTLCERIAQLLAGSASPSSGRR
jgi:ribonucleotide reductase alpha subunit